MHNIKRADHPVALNIESAHCRCIFTFAVWGALLFEALYVSTIRRGTSFDGAEQLLYTQYFDLGYGRSQPPLYTWLLLVSQRIFGVSILAENALKFFLIGVAFSATQSAAFRIWGNCRAGVLAVMVYLLIPEIVWEMQRNYAHSVLLLALNCLMFSFYFALLDRRSVGMLFAFGCLLGMMLLAKYNSAVIIVSLAFSDLWVMRRKAVFGGVQSVFIMAGALIIVSPHLLWCISHFDSVIALRGSFAMASEDSQTADWARGFLSFLIASAGLATLLIFATLFALGSQATLRLATRLHIVLDDRKSVLLLATALFLAISIALTLISAATSIRARWLLPSVVPLAIWLGGHLAASSIRSAFRFTCIAAFAAVVASVGLAVEEFRPGARTAYDYRKLESELTSEMGVDTAVFFEYPIFANLRLSNSDLILADPVMPSVPKRTQMKHPVALWTGTANDGGKVLSYAATLGLQPVLGGTVKQFNLSRWNGAPLRVFALELNGSQN